MGSVPIGDGVGTRVTVQHCVIQPGQAIVKTVAKAQNARPSKIRNSFSIHMKNKTEKKTLGFPITRMSRNCFILDHFFSQNSCCGHLQFFEFWRQNAFRCWKYLSFDSFLHLNLQRYLELVISVSLPSHVQNCEHSGWEKRSQKWRVCNIKARAPFVEILDHRHEAFLKRNRRGSRVLVRGASRVLTPRGDPEPKTAQNRCFSLKIAWKLHGFEEILGARGIPGPQPPGSAAKKSLMLHPTRQVATWKPLLVSHFHLHKFAHLFWQNQVFASVNCGHYLCLLPAESITNLSREPHTNRRDVQWCRTEPVYKPRILRVTPYCVKFAGSAEDGGQALNTGIPDGIV